MELLIIGLVLSVIVEIAHMYVKKKLEESKKRDLEFVRNQK